MADLKGVKVGDKILTRRSGWGTDYEVEIVAKVSPTGRVTSKRREDSEYSTTFNPDGWERTDSSYGNRDYAIPFDQAIIDEQTARQKDRENRKKINDKNWVSGWGRPELIEKIVALIEEEEEYNRQQAEARKSS